MKPYRIEKLKIQSLLSRLTMAVGVILLIFKIYADSEPGAIPLLLIIVSTGWYAIMRVKLQSQAKHE